MSLKPSFVKGYSRQGVALFGLNKLAEAKAVYEAGLKVDPKAAALLEGLQDVEQAEQRSKSKPPQGGADSGLGSMFGPDMWSVNTHKANSAAATQRGVRQPGSPIALSTHFFSFLLRWVVVVRASTGPS